MRIFRALAVSAVSAAALGPLSACAGSDGAVSAAKQAATAGTQATAGAVDLADELLTIPTAAGDPSWRGPLVSYWDSSAKAGQAADVAGQDQNLTLRQAAAAAREATAVPKAPQQYVAFHNDLATLNERTAETNGQLSAEDDALVERTFAGLDTFSSGLAQDCTATARDLLASGALTPAATDAAATQIG